MKPHRSTKLKAVLLILAFLLNTAVGFACAIGTNMGFNEVHHPENAAQHKHAYTAPHQHTDQASAHHDAKTTKDNCCKDEVSKLTTADKESLSASVFSFQLSAPAILQTPVFFQDAVYLISVNIPGTDIARHSRAPVPDVRIAIQSFQI
ncbi:hypothetical protein H7F33_00835 [Pedobacter sp. PAMC26386]|nr:hypothetical protein H7F33_00835 [Pedobacter sp. PAMC26386]